MDLWHERPRPLRPSHVRISQSLDLIERLEALPHPPEVEALLVPDEIHFFLRHATWLNVLGRASDFFDRHLRARAHVSAE